MKKFFFIAASAALALSSCSNEEVVNESVATADNGLTPVAFDTYLSATRSDALTDGNTATSLALRGFGVFAYEQGSLPFYQYYPTALAPNFMNDQKVVGYSDATTIMTVGGTFDHWGYDPIKYWSNNPGDKASFFAYAPRLTGGNNTLEDASSTKSPRLILQGRYNGPAIYYQVPEDLTKAIDLCWGDFNNTGSAAIDLAKPDINNHIKFNFKHALARVTFNAQLWTNEVRPDKEHADETTPKTGDIYDVDANTKITIKSLKLIGNMATEGILRLYDGVWDAQTSTSRTIEAGNYFNNGTNDCPCDYVLNNTATGEQDLFGAADNYLMTIPGGSFKIQVEYEVKTTDSGNSKNSYTDYVTSISEESFTLQAGKSYQFHLNIGMTSAKFTATVSDWTTNNIEEVDLPANFPLVTRISGAASGYDSSDPSVGASGTLFYNTTEGLKKSNGTAWVPVPEAECPEYIVNGTTYYKHTAGGNTYAALAPLDATEYADLAAAKEAALTGGNGYYKVGTTAVYYIQVNP